MYRRHLPDYTVLCLGAEQIMWGSFSGHDLSAIVQVKATHNASAYQDILDNITNQTLKVWSGDRTFLFQIITHQCKIMSINISKGYTNL